MLIHLSMSNDSRFPKLMISFSSGSISNSFHCWLRAIPELCSSSIKKLISLIVFSKLKIAFDSWSLLSWRVYSICKVLEPLIFRCSSEFISLKNKNIGYLKTIFGVVFFTAIPDCLIVQIDISSQPSLISISNFFLSFHFSKL